MNKNINRFIAFLGIGLMGTSALLPSVHVFANELKDEVVVPDSYTPEALAAYQKAHDLIQVAKETQTIEDIRKAYESFILISPEMNVQNYGAYLPEDQMDQVYFEVRELLYGITPEKQREAEILRFATEWKELLVDNWNSLYTYHFRYLVMTNDIKSLDKKLLDLEADLNRYVNGIPTEDGYIPLPTEEEMEKIVKDWFEKHGPDTPDPDPITDKEVEDELAKQFPQDSEDDIVSETIRYEQIGGVWYKIVDTVTNGKVIKSDRRALNQEESYRFLVQQNSTYDPYNNVQPVGHVTQREWKHYTSDQNPESKYTIHYTVNKSETTPYYYDTGIRVDGNKSATYEQYKDVLLVMADKTGGHLVEDQGKILVVLEGKPIVVQDAKEFYSKKELESLFSEFETVDIRIMETSIGQAGSLEEQIVSKQAKSVLVNGTEVNLETFPMVKEERALLPLDEVTYALGGTVSHSDNLYTATKNGNQVVFKLKDNSVYVNGKAIAMKNAPVYKDNVLMVEVTELATAFGYSMIWDGETSTITFESR